MRDNSAMHPRGGATSNWQRTVNVEGVIGATYVHAIENGILSYTDQIPGDYGQIVGKGDKGASANLRSHETPKKVWQFCAFHCFHDRQNKDELLKQSQTFEACHLPTPDWPNTIFDGAQEQVLDSPHQNETREQLHHGRHQEKWHQEQNRKQWKRTPYWRRFACILPGASYDKEDKKWTIA